MDARLKELVDLTKKQWGLTDYYLGRHRLFRRLMLAGETIYFLNMEWFPNKYANWIDEEENPAGTASIDINIHTKEFHSAIFVQGLTYAKNGIVFPNKDVEEVKEWLANFTGLKIEKDFICKKRAERELYFQEQWNRVPLSPSVSIEVEFNEKGELTFYSQNISVLSKRKDLEEEYTLSLSSPIEAIAREQVVLAKFPKDDGTIIVYGVEETFIRNDQKGTVPFILDKGITKIVNKEIVWQNTKRDNFERKYLQWDDEVSIEDAYSRVPHPDSLPITDEEVEKCMQGITEFLQMKYPHESGKWMLKYLNRENSYLHANLEKTASKSLFAEKILIFLDNEGNVINYMDKKDLWDKIMDTKDDEQKEIKVSKEEAYNKLKPYFTLTPYYVFDSGDNKWVLCGKFDCDYFVDVESGEVSRLEDSFLIY